MLLARDLEFLLFTYTMADISCEQGGDLQDYVWVFILARVLIGGGSACTNTIATTYLDDNTHNEDFGFLMGK